MPQDKINGLAGPALAAFAAFVLGGLPSRLLAVDGEPPVPPDGAHAQPAAVQHSRPASEDVEPETNGAGSRYEASTPEFNLHFDSDNAAGLESYADPSGYDGAAPDSVAGAWLRWLVALEAAAGNPAESGAGAGGLLFPSDVSAGIENHAQPYRHLAIAKAVGELEAKPARRKSGYDSDADSHPNAGSPLLALANARNYLNLSEYDKALEWYRQVAVRDADGYFRRETGRETLVAAICARDSTAAGLAVAATLAAPDYIGRESEVVLAFRWLLNRQDQASLGWLLERTATPETGADARITFWRAYSLSWLDRRVESLAELRRLMELGGSGRSLGQRERCWALTATADLLLLDGAQDEAAALYARLADSPVAGLRQWGRLQSAGLAFAAHRYGDAVEGFREVCQSDAQGNWGPHACAMADIAGKLDKLLSEGERYGADAHYRQ